MLRRKNKAVKLAFVAVLAVCVLCALAFVATPNSLPSKPAEAISAVNEYVDFGYTGGVQTFSAPVSGYYKLECNGAEGGTPNYTANVSVKNGGLGGYTAGTVYLDAGAVVYIYVGEAGGENISRGTRASYNGGGITQAVNTSWGASGGGATDIRLIGGNWDDLTSLNSRIIVAGGGGGGCARGDGYGCGSGGAGGGLVGGSGMSDLHTRTGYPNPFYIGTGGTQTMGGYRYAYSYQTLGLVGTGISGSFGIGGADQSGGGGGYYGGAGASHGSPGGGSSFAAGYQSGATVGGKTLSSVTMLQGTHSGNGSARITLVQEDTSAKTTYSYGYTGGAQTFTVPQSGFYYVEAWGARGESCNICTGGYGGYTTGNVYFAAGTTLYLYVGGAASGTTGGYNGGGNSGDVTYGTAGGGATDIRVGGTDLTNRIFVAGGGGGANFRGYQFNGYYGYGNGGAGGGIVGGAGATINTSIWNGYGYGYGTGGTQTEGGTNVSIAGDLNLFVANGGWSTSVNSNSSSITGTFGVGSAGQSGGGGGWYGGSDGAHGGAGGGSSYINGYAGCSTAYYNGNYVFTEGAMHQGINGGNGAIRFTLTESAESSSTYQYTGSGYYTYTAPSTGYYLLEAWGAEGGTSVYYQIYAGGKGGYSAGYIYLNKGDVVYVYIGGAGSTGGGAAYNGGGASTNGNCGGSGGGATDFRLVAGDWNNADSLSSRLLVAGGGGGGNNRGSPGEASTYFGSGLGGAGGGLTGGNGESVMYYVEGQNNYSDHWLGTGGTQTEGGYQWAITSATGYIYEKTCYGAFGIGNSGQSGGGGGWYGGSHAGHGGAGGGSSYISGYDVCTVNCGYVFENCDIRQGIHSGNGMARVSLIKTVTASASSDVTYETNGVSGLEEAIITSNVTTNGAISSVKFDISTSSASAVLDTAFSSNVYSARFDKTACDSFGNYKLDDIKVYYSANVYLTVTQTLSGIYLDHVAPSAPTISQDRVTASNLYCDSVNLTITDNGDTYSGVSALQYSLDNSNWVTGTSYTLTVSGKLYARAVDGFGNISAVTTGNALTIDRTDYTVTYNCGENGENNASNPLSYNVETLNITFGNPNRLGFTFNGWYKESTYTTPIIGIPTQSQGNVSAYAKYTLDSLAVPETSAAIEKSYDAEIETLTCTPSHAAVAKSFTYQWYKDGSAIQNAITDSYTVKNVADSGSYTCAVSVSSDGQSSTATTSPITVAIARRAVTVNANAINKTYGEALTDTFTYQATNLADGEALTGALSCTPIQAFGTYPITQGSLTNENNANYNITFNGANYSIAKYALTVTATAVDKIYGEDLLTSFAYTITEGTLQNSDTALVGALACPTLTQAYGDYPITQGTLTNENNVNYAITFNGANYSIAKYALTVTATPISKTYGEDLLTTFAYTITKGTLQNSDTALNGALACPTLKQAYGDYPITQGTVTNENNVNYTITFNGADYSIAKKDITGATVTLGDSLTYNGEEQTQTVESVVIDELPVTYDLSDNKGTNATEDTAYTLTIKANGNFTGTVTKDFSIAKKDIAGATVTLGDSLTYNGEEQTQTVTSVVIDELTVTYDLSDNKGTNATADTAYTLTIKANGNFTGTITKDFSIAKKDITGATVTLGASLTYNGEEQTQTVESVVIDELAVTYDLSDNTGTNATDYTLTIKANGNFTGTITKDFSIAKKDIAGATVTLGASLTYNGEEQTQTVTSVVIDELPVTYDLSDNKGTNATEDTSYTLTIKANGNFTGTITKDFSIAKKDITGATVTLGDSLTYKGEEQTQTVTSVVIDELPVTYYLTDNKATTATIDTNYTLTITANGNFTGVVTKEYSIARAEYDMSLVEYNNVELTYTGSSRYPTVDESTLPRGKDGYKVEVTYKGGAKNVADGVQTVTATFSTRSTNYNAPAAKTATIKILPIALKVTIADKSSVYGEELKKLTASVKEGYSLAKGEDINVLKLKLTKAVGLTVNTYAITGEYDNTNYTVEFENGTYSITEKAITLNIASKSSVYGDNLVALTATLDESSAFAYEDTLATLSYTLSKANGLTVDTYAITGTDTDNNYDIDFVDGSYEITARPTNVTATAINKTYGDTLVTSYSYNATNLVPGEALSGSLACNVLQAYGVYPITQGTLTNANNTNYNITYYGANYSVAKYALTVTATAINKTYGDNLLTTYGYTITEGELQNNDTALSGTLACPTLVQAYGTYLITQGTLTNDNNTNYSITYYGANYDIAKYTYAVVASGLTKVYGEADSALTENRTLLLGDSVTFTYTREQGENADNYDLLSVVCDNVNYALTFDLAQNVDKFVITPYALSVTASYFKKGIGKSDPSLTETIDGINGEKVAVEYTRENGEQSGNYDLLTVTTANGNYTVSFAAGGNINRFTINRKILVIRADAVSLTYGDALPTLTASVTGFAEGDGYEYISGTLKIATDYKQYDNAGEYTITVSGYTSEEYVLEYYNAKLTVAKRALSITPNDMSLVYGEKLTGVTLSYAGFVGADSAESLSGGYRILTDYKEGSGVGTY